MKVDLGQCAVCGAKNSKYVEKCYKCGATLPWAPGYVAPKNAPQKQSPQPKSQPAPQPVATSADSGAKTVVIPPNDNTPTTQPVPSDMTPTAEPNAAQREVRAPAWAIGVGGLGLVVLGMGLWALLSPKPAPTPVVTPTPIATAPALAPIAPDATANAVTEPTVAPTTEATTEATAAPTVIPTMSATEVPATGVGIEPEVGPTFDELYANLTTGTPQQQALYWESVKGRKINWRGEFVSLGNAATGPLIVNCKSAKGALKVTIDLDATKPQTLPSFTANQSVPFEGILQSRDAGSVTVKEGRVS